MRSQVRRRVLRDPEAFVHLADMSLDQGDLGWDSQSWRIVRYLQLLGRWSSGPGERKGSSCRRAWEWPVALDDFENN